MATNPLFLDTTIQIARLFSHLNLVANIERTVEQSDEIVTSTYVLKEFRARVCRDLVYYYNVLREDCRMSYLFYRNVRLPKQQQRRKQMFLEFQGSFWIEGRFMQEDGSVSDQGDREIAERLKLWLRSAIEDWWDWFHESVDLISDETGCIHAKFGARRIGDTYDCSIRQCDSNDCQIVSFFRDRRREVEQIVDHLCTLSSERLTNELEQIRDILCVILPLLDQEDIVFEGRDCHKCGDAIIMLEAPKDSVFYTSNPTEAEHLKVPLRLQVEYAQKPERK